MTVDSSWPSLSPLFRFSRELSVVTNIIFHTMPEEEKLPVDETEVLPLVEGDELPELPDVDKEDEPELLS
mgnify:FL=1